MANRPCGGALFSVFLPHDFPSPERDDAGKATGKPLSPDEIVHLYPYMAGSGQDEFSTSVYLRVARNADEILG